MNDLKLTQPDDEPRPDPRTHATLRPADGDALDSLLTTRRLHLPDAPDTAGPLRNLTALLDLVGRRSVLNLTSDEANADDAGKSLIAATLARVEAARAGSAAMPEIAGVLPATHTPKSLTLHAGDAAALDAILEPDTHSTADLDPARLAKVRSVLAVLDAVKQEPMRFDPAGETLVQQTLDAAAEQRQKQRFAQQVAMFAEPSRGIGVGWRQVLTAAAVFLIGFSLLMPALETNRQQARQMACATNLAIAGQQMGAYAADFAGMLPRGPVGASWIKTGQPDAVDAQGRYQSNSAHLYLLIKESYVAPQQLACASNAFAFDGVTGMNQKDWGSPHAISYSYQNQHTPVAIRVDRALPSLAVLADKNPLFVVRNERVQFDPAAARDACSPLHKRAGQNILTVDGRVLWSSKPSVGPDNVWQIADHAGPYTGTEAPADPYRDSFLVP